MNSDTNNISAPEAVVFCSRCGSSLETQLKWDKPRRVCPNCGYIHFTDPKVGVGVLVVEDNRILLVRRAMNPERGKWSIPAGFLDHGEDPKLTAVREVKEETGLDVVIISLVDVFFNPSSGHSNANESTGASVFILYRGEVLGGKLVAGDDADAASFFQLEKLPELAFTSTFAAIRSLQLD